MGVLRRHQLTSTGTDTSAFSSFLPGQLYANLVRLLRVRLQVGR